MEGYPDDEVFAVCPKCEYSAHKGHLLTERPRVVPGDLVTIGGFKTTHGFPLKVTRYRYSSTSQTIPHGIELNDGSGYLWPEYMLKVVHES